MTNLSLMVCDGCGQTATPEHLSRRLQRLEWSTRYRPVHIQTLLLGSISPVEEKEFFYSPKVELHEEASFLLDVAELSAADKAPEAVHAEFQRAGYFLTYIWECPFEDASGRAPDLLQRLVQRLPAVAVRIRRSLKPKRVVLISRTLGSVLEGITTLQLGCPLLLDGGKPFLLDGPDAKPAVARLRQALRSLAGT
jgi:hypothetical protein